jgi:hypothetical protein
LVSYTEVKGKAAVLLDTAEGLNEAMGGGLKPVLLAVPGCGQKGNVPPTGVLRSASITEERNALKYWGLSYAARSASR